MSGLVALKSGDRVKVISSFHFDPPVGTVGTVSQCPACVSGCSVGSKYPYVLWDDWKKSPQITGHTKDANGWHVERKELRKLPGKRVVK